LSTDGLGAGYTAEEMEKHTKWAKGIQARVIAMGMGGVTKEFKPEGNGYDMATATQAGVELRDGHYPSLDPRTGMVLKARNHPTWNLMVEEEKRLGNKIIKRGNRYYSVPKTQEKVIAKQEKGTISDILGLR